MRGQQVNDYDQLVDGLTSLGLELRQAARLARSYPVSLWEIKKLSDLCKEKAAELDSFLCRKGFSVAYPDPETAE
jgi:hypothetical protein